MSNKIPTSRFGRLAKLAGAGARAGASVLLGRGEEDAALSAAKNLGQLRALAAKVGQMAAYVDGVVPEHQRDAYERGMSSLLEATPTSDTAEIIAELERGLGQPIDALFKDFEQAPMASASIGQVHRATLHDGSEVAVKVQHPGVGDALRQDLKNADLLERMVGMFGVRKLGTKDMVAEVRQRFLEELDYTLEARRQEAFIRFFEGDDQIIIPKVISSHTCENVLTTTLAKGLGFEQAREQPDELRRQYAETLWRFVYKATLIGRMFNADPHPGNYKFAPTGEVIFLDFGCVQPVSVQRSERALQVHRAAVKRDEEAFAQACRVLMQLDGGQWERLAIDYMRHCFEPQFSSPFRLDPKYAQDVLEHLKDITQQTLKSKGDNFVPLQEGMLFINRLQFGFFSVLGKLNVEADYNSVESSYVFGEPLEESLLPPAPVF